MKKVMYLNFDLDNPEDAYFYQYLESQGRAKKAVIKMALRNTMMPQQAMQPYQYSQFDFTQSSNKAKRKTTPKKEKIIINPLDNN